MNRHKYLHRDPFKEWCVRIRLKVRSIFSFSWISRSKCYDTICSHNSSKYFLWTLGENRQAGFEMDLVKIELHLILWLLLIIFTDAVIGNIQIMYLYYDYICGKIKLILSLPFSYCNNKHYLFIDYISRWEK